MNKYTEVDREVVNSGWFLVFTIGFVATMVFLGLFLGGGIDVALFERRANLYLPLLAGFSLGIVLLGLIGAFIKYRGGELYRKFGFLGNAIHEPESGLLWQIPSKGLRRFLTSFPRVFLVGVIVFSLLGLYYTQQNTFLNELPFSPLTAQSANTFGNIIGAIEPASTTETLILMFFDGIIFSIASWLGATKGWSVATTMAFKLIAFPLSIILWISFHFFVYGSSDKSLIAVGMFAFLTTLFYYLSGSVILPILHHELNNLFLILDILFANDVIRVITTVIILVSIALLVFLTIIQKKEKPLLEVNANG